MTFLTNCLILILGFFPILICKNSNTYKVHCKLINAIYLYNMNLIEHYCFSDFINYDVIESYDRTLWRLWDWGYTQCVSPDVLKKLGPYIAKDVTK